MTGSDPATVPLDARAAAAEGEMDAELDALRAKGPAPGATVRNPVYQHEQRAGTAADAARATDTAAKVTGEIAGEADQERLAIEAEVARIEEVAPGGPQARDAEAVQVQAEHDADEAVAESLDSDVADESARGAEGTGLFHRSADPTAALQDRDRALADEAVAGHDLADLDALQAKVEADMHAAGVPPATS
jgi:hypothetical protein